MSDFVSGPILWLTISHIIIALLMLYSILLLILRLRRPLFVAKIHRILEKNESSFYICELQFSIRQIRYILIVPFIIFLFYTISTHIATVALDARISKSVDLTASSLEGQTNRIISVLQERPEPPQPPPPATRQPTESDLESLLRSIDQSVDRAADNLSLANRSIYEIDQSIALINEGMNSSIGVLRDIESHLRLETHQPPNNGETSEQENRGDLNQQIINLIESIEGLRSDINNQLNQNNFPYVLYFILILIIFIALLLVSFIKKSGKWFESSANLAIILFIAPLLLKAISPPPVQIVTPPPPSPPEHENSSQTYDYHTYIFENITNAPIERFLGMVFFDNNESAISNIENFNRFSDNIIFSLEQCLTIGDGEVSVVVRGYSSSAEFVSNSEANNLDLANMRALRVAEELNSSNNNDRLSVSPHVWNNYAAMVRARTFNDRPIQSERLEAAEFLNRYAEIILVDAGACAPDFDGAIEPN